MSRLYFKLFLFVLSGIISVSCNKDDVITGEDVRPGNAPEIIIDSETGVYTVKKGREITIAPVFRNIDGGSVSWIMDGETVCRTEVYKTSFAETGEYYVTIVAENPNGKTEEEIRIDVVELTPPAVELKIPAEVLKVLVNTDYNFDPVYQFDDIDGFSVEWILDGKKVGTEKKYTFRADRIGRQTLTLKASNDDGVTEKSIEIEVVEKMPYTVEFPKSYFAAETNIRYTFAGRQVLLVPRLKYFNSPEFSWTVDGVPVGCTSEAFGFTPSSPGSYEIVLTVTESGTGDCVTAKVTVECVAATEQSRYRAAVSASSPTQSDVFEYTAAPGQFIGDKQDFTEPVTTRSEAREWAIKRLENRKSVSLGSFGGYIIVGFDHSIPAGRGDYDFAIEGNAYDTSNEPGIVWVMQDVNGNGLPDDEWYELRGSESAQPGTLHDYSVTYFRPTAPRQNLVWTDSEGNSGIIPVNTSHTQDSYFPAWITEPNYTLYGTRLLPHNSFNQVTGQWSNTPYGWGYADNLGSDTLGGDGTTGAGQRNGFRISNAVMADGTPVRLQYVDFIKVQCGVLAVSGAIGEVSTEVFGFEDLSVKK